MTTINDKYEYISIAMDDEDLSDEMLDKLLADDEASQKWYGYHLISDCMKQQAVGRDADFMQSKMFTAALAEISREHQANHAANASKLTHKQPKAANNYAFKGFAVAASLAAVAVSVWQFWPQADTQQLTPVAVEKQQQQVDQNIVPVRAAAENKAASDVVMPNAAKQLAPQQNNTAVHVESQTGTNTPPKEIVQ